MHQEQVLPEQPCDAFNIRDQMVNLMLDEGVYRMVSLFHVEHWILRHQEESMFETKVREEESRWRSLMKKEMKFKEKTVGEQERYQKVMWKWAFLGSFPFFSYSSNTRDPRVRKECWKVTAVQFLLREYITYRFIFPMARLPTTAYHWGFIR